MAMNEQCGSGDYTHGDYDEYERKYSHGGWLWKFLGGLMVFLLAGLALWDLFQPAGRTPDIQPNSQLEQPLGLAKLGATEHPAIPLMMLASPRNVCFARGQLWVVGDKRLCRLDPAKGGADPWSVNLDIEPMAIAVDESSGDCFIAAKDHVRVYDSNGKRKAIWPVIDPKAQLLDIETNGRDVFVADYATRAVYRFDTSGTLKNTIGRKDGAYKNIPGIHLPSPYFDVVLTQSSGRYDGQVRLTNTGKLRIDTYTYDGYFEEPLSFGQSGQSAKCFFGCCNPIRLLQMPDGHYITAEKGIQRLKEYDEAGVFLRVLANRSVLGAQRFDMAMAANPNGEIYLLDEGNSKIRVFIRKQLGPAIIRMEPPPVEKPIVVSPPPAKAKPSVAVFLEPEPKPEPTPKPVQKPAPKPSPKPVPKPVESPEPAVKPAAETPKPAAPKPASPAKPDIEFFEEPAE